MFVLKWFRVSIDVFATDTKFAGASLLRASAEDVGIEISVSAIYK